MDLDFLNTDEVNKSQYLGEATVKVMLQPIVSPHGRLTAQLTSDYMLHVLLIPVEHGVSPKSFTFQLDSKVQQDFLPHAQHLCWSKEALVNDMRESRAVGMPSLAAMIDACLVIATYHRLLVMQLNIPLATPPSQPSVHTLSDVEFPQAYGKITTLDFVFDEESLLVLFDIAPHATILSLTEAHRDDVPNRKFASKRCYATRDTLARLESAPSIALLTRDRHSDVVLIMERGQLVSSFLADTVDAQGAMWAPDGNPILLIWDSASYGTKVKFFSALGHSLRQLDIASDTSIPVGLSIEFSGPGLSNLQWVRKSGSRTSTVLAIGNGSGQIMLRSQDATSMRLETQFLKHPRSLQSSHTTMWQHLGPNQYRPVIGEWDLETDNDTDIEQLAIGSDGEKVASSLRSSPAVAFVWKQGQKHPWLPLSSKRKSVSCSGTRLPQPWL